MPLNRWQWLLALLLTGLLLAWSGAAQAQRVALVVGNAAYTDRPLRNPVNDAALIQTTLSNLGFQVSVLRNADRKTLLGGLRDFEAKARNAEVAVFFYAGHGAQVSGSNYLIPLNAQISAESDVPDEAIDAASVLRRIEDARAKVGLVILDACRDNPYTGSSRSGARGLARMNVPTGTIVAYATAPGSTADDGAGRSNGVYTEQLARYLGRPGLDIKDVFDRTAQEVERLTAGKQRPREEVGLRGRFVLKEGGQQVATARVEPVPPPASPLSGIQASSGAYYFGSSGAAQTGTPASSGAYYFGSSGAALPVATAGQVLKDCAFCPELVVVPAGTFNLGSDAADLQSGRLPKTPDDPSNSSSTKPRVSIPSFAAGRYAVTRGEFASFVAASNYKTEAERGSGCQVWTGSKWEWQTQSNWRAVGFSQSDDHPVVCVSWNDTLAYTSWLSQQTGKRYRLLSESEREYAARAGTDTAFWWGNSLHTGQANYDGSGSFNGSPKGESRRATVPVNRFSANAFGLFNVHGNVWEWVEDCFHSNFVGAPNDGKPWTTNCARNLHIARGGSWFDIPVNLQSVYRVWREPSSSSNTHGFRVARDLK
jgi:formylglycine-generating enzyme required for sulfatase activity